MTQPIQKPWTAANVPDNLKDWPEPMRAKFAEVATQVLAETGDEEKAIQAGIAAAMHLKRVNKAAHSRGTCMLCKEAPPDVEVLWNGAKNRSWFCQKCFSAWSVDKATDIVHVQRLQEGQASKRYRVHSVVKEWKVDIIEKQEEKRIVYGVVLRPNVPDLQNDVYNAEEVEKAAHYFMIESRKADWMHQRTLAKSDAVPVESYIAPADFTVNGYTIQKGDWVMGMHVPNPELWGAIKKGEAASFSIRGVGKRNQVKTS